MFPGFFCILYVSFLCPPSPLFHRSFWSQSLKKRLLSIFFITKRLMSMLDTKHVACSAFKHAKRIIQFLQGKVSSEQSVKKFLDLGLKKKLTCFWASLLGLDLFLDCWSLSATASVNSLFFFFCSFFTKKKKKMNVSLVGFLPVTHFTFY